MNTHSLPILVVGIALSTQLHASDPALAVWVYPQGTADNPISNAASRHDLIEHSASADVTDLYVSLYQSIPNSAGRLMYQDADIESLVQQAHQRRIRIWAAYGDTDWPALGCSAAAFPLQRMAEVNAYNAAHPNARMDGVALDVEPPEPQTTVAYQQLLGLYQCVRNELPGKGAGRVGLAAAIRFFWDATVAFPAGGPQKKVYEHIIDMELDRVTVMGYREAAGSACSGSAPNGIICLDEAVIGYANQTLENGMILVGLETSNCAPGCGTNVTFYADGQSVLDQQSALLAQHFRTGRGFGGFAIHRYQDSFLSGLPQWPLLTDR
jgi:hypothetical protein